MTALVAMMEVVGEDVQDDPLAREMQGVRVLPDCQTAAAPPRLTARVNPTIYAHSHASRGMRGCRVLPDPAAKVDRRGNETAAEVDREGQPYYRRACRADLLYGFILLFLEVEVFKFEGVAVFLDGADGGF